MNKEDKDVEDSLLITMMNNPAVKQLMELYAKQMEDPTFKQLMELYSKQMENQTVKQLMDLYANRMEDPTIKQLISLNLEQGEDPVTKQLTEFFVNHNEDPIVNQLIELYPKRGSDNSVKELLEALRRGGDYSEVKSLLETQKRLGYSSTVENISDGNKRNFKSLCESYKSQSVYEIFKDDNFHNAVDTVDKLIKKMDDSANALKVVKSQTDKQLKIIASISTPLEIINQLDTQTMKLGRIASTSILSDPMIPSCIPNIQPQIQMAEKVVKFYDQSNDLISLINKNMKKFPNPVSCIDLVREKAPNLMSFETGNKSVLRESYKSITDGAYINVAMGKGNSDEARVLAKLKSGPEYDIALQPIINGTKEIFSESSIDEKEIIAFFRFLDKYPFFAMVNPIGKKIYEVLLKMFDSLCVDIESGTEFFRCRVWGKGQDIAFTESEMYVPYRDVAKANRFNNYGIIHLYLASDLKTAKKEVGKSKRMTYIKITNKEVLHLLDMTSFSVNANIIFEYCLKRQVGDSIYPTAYLIPNFISQCCTYYNSKSNACIIDGIRYPSTKSDGSYNIVLFTKTTGEHFNLVELV